MTDDFGIWWRSIPIVTRYWFTASVVIPLLGRIGLFSPWWMALEWTLLFERWHVSSLPSLYHYHSYRCADLATIDCARLLPDNTADGLSLDAHAVFHVQL